MATINDGTDRSLKIVELPIVLNKNEGKAKFCVVVSITDRDNRDVEFRNAHTLLLQFRVMLPYCHELRCACYLLLHLESIKARCSTHAHAAACIMVDIVELELHLNTVIRFSDSLTSNDKLCLARPGSSQVYGKGLGPSSHDLTESGLSFAEKV